MNAADILKYGHQTVLRTIADLPDDAWETPIVCGIWSCKDIIASQPGCLVLVLHCAAARQPLSRSAIRSTIVLPASSSA